MDLGINTTFPLDSKWSSPRLIQLGQAANSQGGTTTGPTEGRTTQQLVGGYTTTYTYTPSLI